MKNKFFYVIPLIFTLLASILSIEVMANNFTKVNMKNNMGYISNISGSFILPYGNPKITLEIKNLKLSYFTNTDLREYIPIGTMLSTIEVKDKYGWAISGGFYSPMFADNMLTVGLEASWMQTTPADDSRSLYFSAAKTGDAPALNSTGIINNAIIGKMTYDGLTLFEITANAKINIPFGNGEIYFYIPAAIGLVWHAGNDNYCTANCDNNQNSISFNGGI
ncbi:MAG: hypothetical protein OEY79_02085 [Anaplasmataceae bacterium]|nr:hypothetical protein [Anaplasmataceae bacterium]